MQLSQLYKNFATSTQEEQEEFISLYRRKRAVDLSSSTPTQRKKTPAGVSISTKLALSEEEKLLMKMLGLKQKDILAMRTAKIGEDEVNEDESVLLKDSTFDEGDE
jgi:hypothetical protein